MTGVAVAVGNVGADGSGAGGVMVVTGTVVVVGFVLKNDWADCCNDGGGPGGGAGLGSGNFMPCVLAVFAWSAMLGSMALVKRLADTNYTLYRRLRWRFGVIALEVGFIAYR